MSGAAGPTMVTSSDGTPIAYESRGAGPPVLVGHGTSADRGRWAPLLPHLEPHVTVHAMDRRGRGGSGDGPGYDVEREYEDVVAVVEDVADRAGRDPVVLGHSFGGLCAYGAAVRSDHVRGLVLYEALHLPDPAAVAIPGDVAARIDASVSAGDRGAALEIFFREVVGMPDEAFQRYRSMPAWTARLEAAHTLTRENDGRATFDPDRARSLTAPVLLLVGGDSPPWVHDAARTVADLLPDAHTELLDGQRHNAIDDDPESFAAAVLAFVDTLDRA